MAFEIRGKSCFSLWAGIPLNCKLKFSLSIARFAAAIFWLPVGPHPIQTWNHWANFWPGRAVLVREGTVLLRAAATWVQVHCLKPQLHFIRLMTADQEEGCLPKVTQWRVRCCSKRMQLHKGLLNLDPAFQRPRRGILVSSTVVVFTGP